MYILTTSYLNVIFISHSTLEIATKYDLIFTSPRNYKFLEKLQFLIDKLSNINLSSLEQINVTGT